MTGHKRNRQVTKDNVIIEDVICAGNFGMKMQDIDCGERRSLRSIN